MSYPFVEPDQSETYAKKNNVPVYEEFLVCSDIEKPTCSVVGAGSKGLEVGEIGDGVDVWFVAAERLHTASGPDVPQLRSRVAPAGHKCVAVIAERVIYDAALYDN